mmetsp:Transcript_14379/g.17341  ORF Transcript_14379/g.17341 Transcript_14379/m.17341 type:complete len:318 (+) Transcript_14379:424-1377(+)
MLVVELIQKIAFRFRAGGTRKLILDLIRDQFFQLGEIFEAKAFCEVVIDIRCLRRADLMHFDFEHGVFAGEVFSLIVFRKRDIDFSLVAGFDADQLIFEAWNERVGANDQRVLFSGAAFEWLAIKLAEKINDHGIIRARLGSFCTLVEFRIGFRNLVEATINLVIIHFRNRLGDREFLDIDRFEFRHHIDMHVIGEIFLAIEHFFHVAFHVHFRLTGRAHIGVFNRFLTGFLNQSLNHFAHNVLAEHFFDVRGRHFSGAEAFEVHLRANFFNPLFEPFLQVSFWYADLIHMAQTFIGLDAFHSGHSLLRVGSSFKKS